MEAPRAVGALQAQPALAPMVRQLAPSGSTHVSSSLASKGGPRRPPQLSGPGCTSTPLASGLGAASLTACVAGHSSRRRRRGGVGSMVHSSDVSAQLEASAAASQFAAVSEKVGVLLMNIGTPASTEVHDVRDYLARFLGDDRVIELQPPFLKFIILQILLGVRPQKSAEAYKAIWDESRGSPLQFHTEDLVTDLQQKLGDQFVVRHCFQYSAPFTTNIIREFTKDGIDNVILVPMFPQYASSTVGTCLQEAYEVGAKMYCTPCFSVVPPFYNTPQFLHAQTEEIAKVVGPHGCNVDHTLFSFHGLPTEQCSKSHSRGTKCGPGCAEKITATNKNCYHGQCHETARRLAAGLGLKEGQWSVAFQSRLTLRNTVEWIGPYTDKALAELAKSGVRRLALAAPSFTIDCLETLEELSITGEEQFKEAGGEELMVVPCINASEHWVTGLSQLVKLQAPAWQTTADAAATAAADPKTPGHCPVSGRFGIWRQSHEHKHNEAGDSTPTSKTAKTIELEPLAVP
mmetsp:Transcript_34035/g.66978  ORF Transcript_34035/g.66978 Transcript_34035/m.66978 type:complete len:517 (+) Transcript_34035:41-1591(+)